MAVDFKGTADELKKVLAAAASAGAFHQNADGRATYMYGLNAAAVDDQRTFYPANQISIPKTTGIVILDGGRVYFDRSAGSATFRTVNDRDFYVGVAVGDAASADSTIVVNLNVEPRYETAMWGGKVISQNIWTPEATNGLGVTPHFGGAAQFAFDAVAEAAQVALYSERTFPIASNAIFEFRWAIANKGDNSALDIDIGLSNGSHATDFESVTEYVAFHLDGNTLDLDAHSKDGFSNVSITDTTINLTEGTYVECWIDCRDQDDIQMYVDGVLVLGSSRFTLNGATGPVKPIIMMEKTSDDTVADLRVAFAQVRIAEQ